MEAAPRVELGITILQTVALATWLCRPRVTIMSKRGLVVNPGTGSETGEPDATSGQKNGAGNETRTRDSYLGKVVLYQLSYARSEGLAEIMNLADFVKLILGFFRPNPYPGRISR